ncbi:hypothetical protein NQZ68_017311 [Dissostichus eleginoides]|nr:hypothetical protein NQZ68_017311 [Dissostichus eleginoides]
MGSDRRPGLVLCWFLLCVSLQPDSLHQASAVNLRRFIGCAVREFTFQAKKPGCGGLHITTDACWGRCETWEKPVLDPPFIESHQRVCTYNETRLVSVKLPNCQPTVDPTYTYPVALRCDCEELTDLRLETSVDDLSSSSAPHPQLKEEVVIKLPAHPELTGVSLGKSLLSPLSIEETLMGISVSLHQNEAQL